MLMPTYIIVKAINIYDRKRDDCEGSECNELRIICYTTDVDYMEEFIKENPECFAYQSNDIINHFNHPEFYSSKKYIH